MHTRLESQMGKYAGKYLGLLVNALFDSYVVVDGAERPLLDDKSLPSDRISGAAPLGAFKRNNAGTARACHRDRCLKARASRIRLRPCRRCS